MTCPNKYKVIFKTIASLVAAIFLWNQIAWAGDFIDYTLEKQAEEQTQMFSPNYVQKQEAIHQSLIEQMQGIEDNQGVQTFSDTEGTRSTDEVTIDLQGPKVASDENISMLANEASTDSGATGDESDYGDTSFSVTTNTGDIIHYKAGKIHHIEIYSVLGFEGTVIYSVDGLTLADNNGILLNADIEYSDGTKEEVCNGQVVRLIKPNGTIFYYENEKLVSVSYPEDEKYMTYEENDLGNTIEKTWNKDNEVEQIAYYDTNDKLKKVEFPGSSKIIEYNEGILSKIIDENGEIQIFEIIAEQIINDETVYIVGKKSSTKGDTTTTYTYIKDTQGNITDIEEIIRDNNITTNVSPIDTVEQSRWYVRSGNCLVTYWGNEYLDYLVDFGQDNENVNLAVSAINSGLIDSDYENFKVEVYIDSESKGVFSIPASMDEYQTGSIDLGSIEGEHTVRIKWLNDWGKTVDDQRYDANIKINKITFTEEKTPKAINHYDQDGYIISSINPVLGVTTTYTYIKDTQGNITDIEEIIRDNNITTNVSPIDTVEQSRWYVRDGNCLVTYWGNEYLDYLVNFGEDNENVNLTLSAINSGLIDSDYENFKVEVYIDSESKGVFSIPASMDEYQTGSIDLGSIEGEHTVRIKWLNDWGKTVDDQWYDANIKINKITFTEEKTPTAINHYDGDGYITSSIDNLLGKTTTYTYIKDTEGNITDIEEVVRDNNVTTNVSPIDTVEQSRWYVRDGNCLVTYWGNEYLDYLVNFGQDNENVNLDVSAINVGLIDSDYGNFKLEVYVDSVSKGTFLISASMDECQTGSINLGPIEGEHTVRIKWLNDWGKTVDDQWYDANIKINNITFTEEKVPTAINHYSDPFDFLFNFRINNLDFSKSPNSEAILLFYNADKEIIKAIMPNGGMIAYKDNLPNYLKTGSEVTQYTFGQSELKNINGIIAERDGISTIYDNSGNLIDMITDEDIVISFVQGGDISSITDSEGTKFLYEEKHLSSIIDKENVEYALDSDNRIKHAKHSDGREYDYYYDVDGEGNPIVIVYDCQSKGYRYYRDDFLYYQINEELGLESFYTYTDYNDEKELSHFIQKKGEKTVNEFIYIYPDTGTNTDVTVKDNIKDEIRVYDSEGKIQKYQDANGHVYKFNHSENGELVSELTELHKDDGRIVYYKNGAVDRVDCPGNVIIKNIEFDNQSKLKKFILILPNGEIRNCGIYGDWVDIVTPGGSKLIYEGDCLIAVNYQGRLFRFRDDEIPEDIELDLESAPEPIEFNTMSSSFQWRMPGVSWPNDYLPYSDPLSYHVSITGLEQSERYVDLEYRTPYGGSSAPYYNLKDKKVSFYVKLEEGTLQEGSKVIIDAFVKNPNWQSEHSTEVTITKDNRWYKVDLTISDETPLFGHKDYGFDPEKIRLVGVRLRNPYNTNTTYSGNIYVIDANYSTLPEGEYVDAPFLMNEESVKPYVGLLFDEQDPSGNPNYRVWDEVPSKRKDGYTKTSDIILDEGDWRYQTVEYSQGIQGITRINSANYWELDADLQSGSSTSNDGEVFVDLRYDLPNYDYKGPLDLTGKTLTFKVKAPEGFIADPQHQGWAQVYVKDEEYDYQYSSYVNISQADEWYTVILIPQYGDIAGGKTHKDFDPTRIVNIGVKFSCGKGSDIDFEGKLYVMNATDPEVFNSKPPEMLVDLSTLSQYAKDNEYVVGFEEELGPEIQLAKEHLPNYFKDDKWAMRTEYDSRGKAVNVLKGNKRVEHFDVDGRLVKITDPEWDTVVTYSYDDEGGLIDIDYEGTRIKTRETIQKAKVDIETRTAKALCDLADAKNGAENYVYKLYQPAIDECDRILRDLYSALQAINAWDPFWWWEYEEKREKRNEIEHAIAEVNSAKGQLLQAKVDAYEAIDADIADARENIMAEYESSMALVLEREANAETEILEQEIEQLLCAYYGKILGRNPNREEMDNWLDAAREQGCLNPEDRITFDISIVEEDLLSVDNVEYNERKVFNEEVKQAVSDFLYVYVDADTTPEERRSMLKSLGLTPEEINELNKATWGVEDVNLIIDWMTETEINFGRCAFETVYKFLKDANVIEDPDEETKKEILKEIAIALILIDIAAGAIDCFTEGPLEISLYAMDKHINKYLDDKGSENNVQCSSLDFAELISIIDEGKDAIVHLDTNHFIIVTAIDAEGNVTYFETNNGPIGEALTVDSVTFRMQWTGYVISERAPPEKTILAAEALSVRGNLDPFTIFIICIAAISAVLSFIDNEVCQIISKILGVASLVLSVFAVVANLPSILTTFYEGMAGIGTTISAATSEIISIASSGFSGLIANLPNLVLNSISAISLNIAITQGMSFLNINSDIARITASFFTGGFLTPDNFLAGALVASARTGIGIFGRETGLDPFITNLISTTACSLGFAFFNGGFDALVTELKTTVLPNFTAELAYIGVQKIGELVGIDPRISYIAGIGIRSSLRMGFGNGGLSAQGLFQGAMTGLAQGVASIGLNYLTEEFDLNPLLANIGFSALSLGIEGLINESGFFEHVFGTYKKNALTSLGYNPKPNAEDYWYPSYKYRIFKFLIFGKL